jgi:hypothetical protein
MDNPESEISQAQFSTEATRRNVLGLMGMSAIGWLASATPALGFFGRKESIPKVSVATAGQSQGFDNRAIPFNSRIDLPEEWLSRHGRGAQDYLRFLQSLRLRRVDARQVLETHAKQVGSVWNTLPHPSTWKCMGYTLKIVERIAMEMDVREVEVISAYRSPAYNARLRGRSASWHKKNAAVDVRFPVRASSVTATARELRQLGLFRGGVGGYRNFTHIDCRGSNVDW